MQAFTSFSNGDMYDTQFDPIQQQLLAGIAQNAHRDLKPANFAFQQLPQECLFELPNPIKPHTQALPVDNFPGPIPQFPPVPAPKQIQPVHQQDRNEDTLHKRIKEARLDTIERHLETMPNSFHSYQLNEMYEEYDNITGFIIEQIEQRFPILPLYSKLLCSIIVNDIDTHAIPENIEIYIDKLCKILNDFKY